MAPTTPPVDLVSQVVAALEVHGATAAIGGSGLLASLNLVDHVRDWDVTTDAGVEVVETALNSIGASWSRASSGTAPYATRARYTILGEGHEVDVIVGFALTQGAEVVPLPTRVAGSCNGLPMADPAVWLTAYRLLGRHEKADRLQEWLTRPQ